MTNQYVLLNPYLEGKLISSSKSDINSVGEEIWGDISTKIKNYIPEFYFTVQNKTDDKLHHFKVKESLENERIKYSIKLLNNTKYHANDNVLLSEINSLKNKSKSKSKSMSGGRKHKKNDDSSSSSSSSDDDDDLIFKFNKKQSSTYSQFSPFAPFAPVAPIMSLNYYPSIYGVRNILLPSFVGSFTPYVKINLPLTNSVIITP